MAPFLFGERKAGANGKAKGCFRSTGRQGGRFAGGSDMVKKVRLVRIARGYLGYKFAALVGVHPNLWHEIEMGTRKPSEGVMLRASEVLGRPVEELFSDAEEALNFVPTTKEK